MTEVNLDYEFRAAELERENAELKAQVAQMQADIASALALIHSYGIAADLVRATVPVFPRLVKQEAPHA